MALVLGRARQHQGAELVATIVNAFVHHESAVAVDDAVAHAATGGAGWVSRRPP